jgi:two-component system, CAI-1 autoinducer sensor kinase/phosphatase CqsS
MKIIIADDFYSNRLLIIEILKDLGHELIEAENGRQAIDALENNNDVDLMLMDIEMPVMSGLEAMSYIRNNLSYPKNSVPIIALTAHNSMVLMDEPNIEGFNGMLIKPYSISRISEILEMYKR